MDFKNIFLNTIIICTCFFKVSANNGLITLQENLQTLKNILSEVKTNDRKETIQKRTIDSYNVLKEFLPIIASMSCCIGSSLLMNFLLKDKEFIQQLLINGCFTTISTIISYLSFRLLSKHFEEKKENISSIKINEMINDIDYEIEKIKKLSQ